MDQSSLSPTHVLSKENHRFTKIKEYVSLLKDIALILCIPPVFVIILQNHSTEVAALNARIALLEKTSYTNAISELESQEKVFKRNQYGLQRRIQMVGGGHLEFDDFFSRYMCLKLKHE